MISIGRTVFAYALLSLALACGLEWTACEGYPTGFSSSLILKDCVFVLVNSGLLFVLLRREAARRDQIEQGLRLLAIHDSLTGLLNRTCFIENLESAIARATRDGKTVGVAFIDLDHFKEVNDSHGHQFGDELLIDVAKRIKAVVRAADSAARFGGDEFVVLVHGDQASGIRRTAERLVEAFREPFIVRGRTIMASASIGYALYPDHGEQAEKLLHAADMAMYEAKRMGKNSLLEAVIGSGEEPSHY